MFPLVLLSVLGETVKAPAEKAKNWSENQWGESTSPYFCVSMSPKFARESSVLVAFAELISNLDESGTFRWITHNILRFRKHHEFVALNI